MLNTVSLNGYITKKPFITTACDGRIKATFTLNVQRDHHDEDNSNSNVYDYIPIITYSSSDDAGLPNDYSDRIIKVQGRLITYPNYQGKIKWGVLANSVSVKEDDNYNPFSASTN